MTKIATISTNLFAGAKATWCFIWLHRYYTLASIAFISILTAIFHDQVENWAFYTRALNDFAILLIYVFVLCVKQVRETLVPWDVYTRLRIYILVLLLIGTVTLAPAVTFQFLVAIGYESTTLRNIINFIGLVNRDATAVLLMLVFYYRIRR